MEEKVEMDLEKKISFVKMTLYLALGLAGVGLIVLIVGLIAGAVVADIIGVLLLVLGVALVIYQYPDLAKYTNLKAARDEILGAKSLTEVQLANKMHLTERKARELIDQCFRKGHVPGYIRKGQKIYFHEHYAEESESCGKKVVAVNCENCGANFKGVVGEPNECPYCRSYINV